LIDSWETARACAMGVAGVVCGWHGSRYRKGRINCIDLGQRRSIVNFRNDMEIMHEFNILDSVAMKKIVKIGRVSFYCQ